jgi:hypothetical protein
MPLSKCVVRLKDSHDTEHSVVVYAESLSHISILNFTYKPLDARFHLCLCRFERDEDGWR